MCSYFKRKIKKRKERLKFHILVQRKANEQKPRSYDRTEAVHLKSTKYHKQPADSKDLKEIIKLTYILLFTHSYMSYKIGLSCFHSFSCIIGLLYIITTHKKLFTSVSISRCRSFGCT